MKILLIYPPFLEKRPDPEDVQAVPIGLYWVASLLMENGYDVELLNWFDVHHGPEQIEKTLQEKNPDVIGFSVLHANRWGAVDIARTAKNLNPQVVVVFGGVGATFLWKHFLTHFDEIDFVVRGEGEFTFLNLVRYLESGNPDPPDFIKGLAFRKDGRTIKTAEAPRIKKLDELPIPAKYFTYQHVALTRGCPWNCRFCGSPAIWRRRVTFRSTDHFVAELELLHRKGVRFFYVSDDTFTLDKRRIIEVCKKILARRLRINWVAISRVNYVDEEILYWMRLAGCIQISFGVESGSEHIRRVLNKEITTEQIKKAFALTAHFGILPRGYFIYGSPGENGDTINETVQLIKTIKPLSIVTYILDIFPGTSLYRDFLERTGANDDVWLNRVEDIMYFEIDPDLTEDRVLAFGERIRTEFYRELPNFSAAIDLVDKPELRPFHADFLSRLGMTFSHGAYSHIDAIPGKEDTAAWLFTKALEYFPEHSAFLGLGIIHQKNGEHEECIRLLLQAIESYPQSEPISVCLGISYAALGRYQEALPYFLRFQDSEQALRHALDCYRMLGDREGERTLKNKLQAIRR